MARRPLPLILFLPVLALPLLVLTGCGSPPSQPDLSSPYAPGLDPRGEAVDGLVVGDRLLAAGEYELAIDAYTRAALVHGLTPEIYAGIGTANLQLGRLGQAEEQLRLAARAPDTPPEVWNNLGLVLVGKGEVAEGAAILRRAYALDNGGSDAIRANLRLALAMLGERPYDDGQEQEFQVVRSGQSVYKIRTTDPG
ncbi:tetratricopeptide repeat protein [Oceanicola sp. S124]|uniref:tetratricopeptide repeat protein n=1 Tax=Oceanicola sp. S124 TaxID=1042378 RepID=UPI0002558CCA|nr:tetratricopeptide repeat protein [Oceanicola sp. S124]